MADRERDRDTPRYYRCVDCKTPLTSGKVHTCVTCERCGSLVVRSSTAPVHRCEPVYDEDEHAISSDIERQFVEDVHRRNAGRQTLSIKK